MLHPLFSTVVQRPDLVMDHVSAYAALFHQEATAAGSDLIKRALAWALAIVGGAVFLIFAGVALMFGFVQNQFHWVLVIVPAAALLLTLLAIVQARKPMSSERFPELKAQIDSDAQALRMAA